MKCKSIYCKYLLLKIKYIFLRDSYVCTRWIFIFDSDQAQINSVSTHKILILIFFCFVLPTFSSENTYFESRRCNEVHQLFFSQE